MLDNTNGVKHYVNLPLSFAHMLPNFKELHNRFCGKKKSSSDADVYFN